MASWDETLRREWDRLDALGCTCRNGWQAPGCPVHTDYPDEATPDGALPEKKRSLRERLGIAFDRAVGDMSDLRGY